MKKDSGLAVAAAAVGLTLAVTTFAGGALLLFVDTGVLTSIGVLAGVAFGALAAGIWVAAPEPQEAPLRAPRVLQRWAGASIVLLAAGVFALSWAGSARFTMSAGGRAIAVLLFLAAPCYMIGALLVTLSALRGQRRIGSVALAALLGVAVGAFVTTAVLIPKLDAGFLFVITGALMTSFGYWWSRWLARVEDREMKVAIVTGVGGAGQVGYAVAQSLLRAGARVVITDISERVAEHAAALGDAASVSAIAADLTDPAGAQRLIDHAVEQFGKIDWLVNVAGGLSVIRRVADTTPEEWHRELERNATSAFYVTRAALPHLRVTRGAIVNFASPAGFKAPASLGAYSAAKAAVIALTHATAVEERSNGVRANAIAPGIVDTEQNRKSVSDPDSVKWVTREQICDAVLFLLGSEAFGISGDTIEVLGEGVA